MSEKIYLFMLGLYPSKFREAYGDEAIQLFRDRLRDEQGFIARARLWWDLLTDLVDSLPREYSHLLPSLVNVSAQRRLEVAPYFKMLDGGSPGPVAWCLGALLSVTVLAAISTSMNWAARKVSTGASVLADTAPAVMKPSMLPAATPSGSQPPGQNAAGQTAAAESLDTPLPAAEDNAAQPAAFAGFLTSRRTDTSKSIARTQTFASIVIRPSAITEARESRLQILPSGDLIGYGFLLNELLSFAYDVPTNPSPRLSSLPEWTDQRFDVEAKVPVSLRLDSKDITSQQRVVKQLIRTFLAEGFGPVLNVKKERVPVYALSVAKGGLKLNRSAAAPSHCILDTSQQGCHNFAPGFGHPLNANEVDMSDLADYLENWTDIPVVNRTGLARLFTMHSQGWKPMTLPPPPPGTAATGIEFADLPSLSSVLGEFGLQLVRQQENVPFYTIVRIHPPDSK